MELLIRQISRKYEIKKQMIGEDADLEKSGRILNRVIDGNETVSQSKQTKDTSGRY